MSSSLRKALERFDRLSEAERAQIAREMIPGAIEIDRRGKTRGLQEA